VYRAVSCGQQGRGSSLDRHHENRLKASRPLSERRTSYTRQLADDHRPPDSARFIALTIGRYKVYTYTYCGILHEHHVDPNACAHTRGARWIDPPRGPGIGEPRFA